MNLKERFLDQALKRLKMKLILRKPEPKCSCDIAQIKILPDGSHLLVMKCGRTEHIEK